LKPHLRAVDPELNVPLPIGKAPARQTVKNELEVLAVLAENYRVNPGLHMTLDDIKEWVEVSDADLIKYLETLEEQGYAGLYRTRHGISLARATLSGLQKAHPPEYYRNIPAWADPDDMF
jgi:hypothetical protein